MTAKELLYTRLEQMSMERGDFITLEDGYIYFWPTRQLGAISATELRILADILDEKNKEWDAQVQQELGRGTPVEGGVV